MTTRLFIQTFIPEGVKPKTDFEFGQALFAEVTTPGRFFGTNVKRHFLDKEVVPAWAVIQRNALGSSDWRSKFAKYGYFNKIGHGISEIQDPDLEAARRDYKVNL